MKSLLLFSIIVLFFLGACEEIVYKDVIKYVDRPVPQFIETSKTEECVSTDTAKVEILFKDIIENGQIGKDTVLSVTTACHMKITVKGKVSIPHKLVEVHDSIPVYIYDSIPYPVFVEVPGPPPPAQIIYKDTTIYETRIEYQTVQYVYLFPGQSSFYMPDDLMGYYQQYYADAQARNVNLNGGDVVVQRVPQSQLPGEAWVSTSWEMSGSQYVILLDETLTVERSKAAMYRELTHWQLKKQYSNDVNKIMSNFFRTSPDPTVQEINILFN